MPEPIGQNRLLKSVFRPPAECPKCRKPTRFYRIKGRRGYAGSCGCHIYPLAPTALRKSSTSTTKWQQAFLMLRSDRTTSCRLIQRATGVTYKTAWRMKKLITEHLAEFDGYFSPLSWSEDIEMFEVAIDQDASDLEAEVMFKYRQEAAESRRRIAERFS